jgi:hypothetical protein
MEHEPTPSKHEVITPDLPDADRQELEEGLAFANQYRDKIEALPRDMQEAILEMGTRYLHGNNFISFKKLFKNAIPYIAEGRIKHLEDGSFEVYGMHPKPGEERSLHRVTPGPEGKLSCDCDYFTGKPGTKFEGKGREECSHIQTANLLLVSEHHSQPK